MDHTMHRPLFYIDLSKALEKPKGKITRKEAKAIHKNLPEGGVWRTIRGHHVYIVNNKVVAGSLPKVRGQGAKKATKAHLKELQEHIDKENKAKRSKKGAETKKRKKADGHAKAEVLDTKAKTKKTTAKKTTAKKTTAKKTTTKKTTAKKTATEQKVIQVKKKRMSKKEREALSAPVLQRPIGPDSTETRPVQQSIPQNTSTAHRAYQQRANEDFSNKEMTTATKTNQLNAQQLQSYKDQLDAMWNSPEVQKLLNKPVSKRSKKAIKEIAGKLTTAMNPLAVHYAQKKASRLGAFGSPVRMGERSGGGLAQNAKAVTRDDGTVEFTGLHGDFQQVARATMFETLHNILAGSQNPKEGTKVSTHVIKRMTDAMTNAYHNFLNAIPVKEKLRPAIKDLNEAESMLSHKLGRRPTDEELAKYLEENSKHFRDEGHYETSSTGKGQVKKYLIPALPKWNPETKEWEAKKGRIEDPVERLRALRTYRDQQKAGSVQANVGSEGEREVELGESLRDMNESPEERTLRRERQQEVKSGIERVFNDLGIKGATAKVLLTAFSGDSRAGKLTHKEVADVLNAAGHTTDSGNKFTHSNVRQLYSRGMKKLQQAREQNHPKLMELYQLLTKSMIALIERTFFQIDLLKSLQAWGLGLDVLEERFSRVSVGQTMEDIYKSLAPYEGIGTLITTEDGMLHARIVELTVPETNSLYKSFNQYLSGLKKALFPHKANTNHALNQKASQYVKANASKFEGMANAQLNRIREKQGGGRQLTWSEQLQLKTGGVWITWGGKRILIQPKTGHIEYDSRNDAHREEYNAGAQEHKIEFHHEAEALDEHERKREEAIREEWEGSAKDEKARKKLMRKHRGVSFDDAGNLQFTRDTSVNEDNIHHFDEGIKAFQHDLNELRNQWKDHKSDIVSRHKHKTVGVYGNMSEDQRKELDRLSSMKEREKYIGDHILQQEGVKDLMNRAHQMLRSGQSGEQVQAELQDELKALGKKHGSLALQNKKLMTRAFNALKKKGDVSEEDFAEQLGKYEVQRGGEEANKRLLDEGTYMIGNPITGKAMAVRIKHVIKDGNYTAEVAEAFDPEGGYHEEIHSWGQLGRALGFKGASANKIQENIVQNGNKTPEDPMLKQMSEDEFMKARSKTRLGLQESMLHKNFKLVQTQRDKSGNITSQTFAQDMPDGTQNVITVDRNGYIMDPIMARLINQKKPIKSIDDLHEVLKNAVGNRAWVTAHVGSDIHIGDALAHHIQLEYDGKGAPRVVGGKYDGYRFIDSADVPKGAIDPATGEPVKALFNNGKLVDRRFTTKNKVAMTEGNAVLYDAGNGRYRKGRIHSIEGDNYKILNNKGQLVGIFKKDQLKHATEEGRTLSDSGQAVVRLAKDGTHRMKISEVFGDDRKGQKARALFEEALRKAKINRGAFDSEGNLREELELSDPMMNRLQKVLGRSKAGREILSKFNSTYRNELEIHVPENLREHVEAEGVRVLKNGTARISVGKFEQLRNALGGLSLDHKARAFLNDYFRTKDRVPRTQEELRANYQPAHVADGHKNGFGKHYKSQFKANSFLMDKNKGLYGTQLEGVAHMIERGRALVGHGMGVGKTITGVVAHAHYKAQKLANGEKPKKSLIVAPKGIMSDWGKEIGTHTNMKGLYIGSGLKKKGMVSENGRSMFGQDGTEQESMTWKEFHKNMDSLANEDHDFHIVSYDTFMKNREHLANSGLYDNIIIDEVHAFKNQKGARGKSLSETTDKFQNVWGLSGTPMENDAREMYNLIDTITGGKHELGSMKEFQDNYMIKDRNGKIVGIKPSMAEKLGDILANIVQFRSGTDVTYNDGSKIKFPHLVGQTSDDNPNPKHDFIGDMVDRNRDHQTTDYYGTKHSVTDYETATKTVTDPKSGEQYEVQTYAPKNLSPMQASFYDRYKELQQKLLPESKLRELATASATGYDTGRKGKSNYLTAMQKLQKFLNAPLAEKMYVPGGKNAIEASETDAQGTGKTKSESLRPYNPETGEGHYIVDENGHKRYFESDGKGGFLRNEDGSPKLLPPLHHNNPKAQYLKERISKYLDALEKENAERRKRGAVELMPKVVVKSNYTTFGTDVIDSVMRDLQKEHPELLRWADKLKKEGKELGTGRFTGDAEDREATKTGFRGNKNDYANNQGHLWATSVSPAGKEGVDFGNAHLMLHFDQDWNPQRMAQFTARVRRSDSNAKAHASVGRDNSVRVESLHMPGTVEDFLFNAQDSKMRDIQQVVKRTREAEQSPRYGDSSSTIGFGVRGFTRGRRRRIGTKPKNPSAARTEKAVKLVLLV